MSEDAHNVEAPKSKKARLLKPKIEPSRRSTRNISFDHASLPEDFSDSDITSRRRRAQNNAITPAIRQLPAPAFPEEESEFEVNYDPEYRAPLPTRDVGSSGYGKLRFIDAPHFTPNLLPQEIMTLGSFGGTYFRPFYSSVCRRDMPPDYDEFPKDWCESAQRCAQDTLTRGVDHVDEGLDTERYLTSREYDPEVNK